MTDKPTNEDFRDFDTNQDGVVTFDELMESFEKKIQEKW